MLRKTFALMGIVLFCVGAIGFSQDEPATKEEVEKLTNQDIADFLGGLPKEKMHCSVLGRQALEKALANYRGIAPKEAEGEIVCECFGVTDREIERAGEVITPSIVTDDPSRLALWLKNSVRGGDLVFFKASRGVALERVFARFLELMKDAE